MAVVTSTNDELKNLGNMFLGVVDVAQTPLNLFGFMIAPFDIWLTTAIIYMLFDIFYSYMWGDTNGH